MLNIKTAYFISFISVFMGMSFLFPISSQAANQFQPASTKQLVVESDENIPLVVIRFNQKHMYYDRQLYQAASKAVGIKPSVIFDVVSFVPVTRNKEANRRYSRKASSETFGVVNSLLKMGVPKNHIRVSKDNAPDIRYHEVHIYVE